MKTYISPLMRLIDHDDTVIVTSGEATVNGPISNNPVTNPGDVGAPDRRTIWK